MLARIYKPAKTAMQSGRAKTQFWYLEFEQASARSVEPLMGWTSSSDMRQQVKLKFATKEDAIGYAERNPKLKHPESVVKAADRARMLQELELNQQNRT